MEIVRTIEDIQKIHYADLVDEYSDAIYKLCRSLTYSKEDAEDLFQETFLKAFRQQTKFCESDNPQGLLFSACTYIWKSRKRKYARRSRLVPLEPLDETVADDAGIEDSFIAREELKLVRRLVEELPEKFKIPIILYYTLELSIPEIALTLQLPAGTVKSRLYKARKLVEKGLVDAL